MIMATGLYAGTTLPDNGRPVLLLDVQGLLAAAAIDANEAGRSQGQAAEAEAETVAARNAAQLLLFRDTNARIRGVRLSVIERVEEVPVSSLRSEEHTSELQSLMRTSNDVFCMKKKQKAQINQHLKD